MHDAEILPKQFPAKSLRHGQLCLVPACERCGQPLEAGRSQNAKYHRACRHREKGLMKPGRRLRSGVTIYGVTR